MYRHLTLALILAACLAPLRGQIPGSVMAEPDLEKRSELALKAADEQISLASKTYANDSAAPAFEEHVRTVGQLAQLSLKSLQDTGKRASKKPKYFKRAELKLRSLLRRLDSLEKDVSMEDRGPVEKVKLMVSETHEQILHDILSKR